MRRISESKFISHFRHSQAGGKFIPDLADDELTDMPSRAFPRHLPDHVAEIIGRHAEMLGTHIYRRKSLSYLPSVSEIMLQETVESREDVVVYYNTSVIFESLLTAPRSQVFNPLKI